MPGIFKYSRIKLVIYSCILFLIIFFYFFSRGKIYDKQELEYGVTFSSKKAEEMGFDWKSVYLAMIRELGAKKLRLPAYWDEIEGARDEYVWTDLDWQMEVARESGVEVMLAVGGRLPRWPECHYPSWARNLDQQEREERILEYIGLTINRYKEYENIGAWQVENEPFLSHFGDCPELDSEFLDREIAEVKRLDSRPVVITDSGEISIWIPAAKRADIFGTTMYRDTFSQHLRSYIHYPVEPGFFRFKKNFTGLFAKPKDWIVIELQAEPWCPVPYQETTKAERDRTMNYEKFNEILEFSRLAGFKTFYLWGVEWWYWEKMANGDDRVWEEAKILFQ